MICAIDPVSLAICVRNISQTTNMLMGVRKQQNVDGIFVLTVKVNKNIFRGL